MGFPQGGDIAVQDEGVTTVDPATTIDFQGVAVAVTSVGAGVARVTIDVAVALVDQRAAAAGTDVFSVGVTVDTNNRFVVNADGTLEWGPGNAAVDVNLYRSAADTLKTDDSLIVDQNVAILNGLLLFGPTFDVNLFRGAADQLKTNDGLNLNSGALAGAASPGSTFFSGTGAPNNANGANGDFYFRLDGGALTTIYQRRAGAWVGLI